MKTAKPIFLTLLTAGILICQFQGCSTTPKQVDTDQIQHHADESFKELQHEEEHQAPNKGK